MNGKETPPSNCEVRSVSFITMENNSGAEIHRHLCAAYREENVMNLRKCLAMAVNVPRKENKHTRQ